MALQQFDASIRCDFANDGAKALEQLKADEANVPHCIFIDMNMPRMNGQECLAEIKKCAQLKNIPVVVYSTSSKKEYEEESKNLGAMNFFIKPPDFTGLTKYLKTFLS